MRGSALVAALLIFFSFKSAIAARARVNVIGGDPGPPFDKIVNTYIHYGGNGSKGEKADCLKFMLLFAYRTGYNTTNSTMLTPVSAGPTGITDTMDPVQVCLWITAASPISGSTFTPWKNKVLGDYTLISMSASFYRLGFAWEFWCNGKGNRVYTNLWLEYTGTGMVLQQWELTPGTGAGSYLAAIDTGFMCPHY